MKTTHMRACFRRDFKNQSRTKKKKKSKSCSLCAILNPLAKDRIGYIYMIIPALIICRANHSCANYSSQILPIALCSIQGRAKSRRVPIQASSLAPLMSVMLP